MTTDPEDRLDENTEHERRFLVADRTILTGLDGVEIEQAYLAVIGGWAVRARRIYQLDAGGEEDISSVLTLKGPRSGYLRPEYEMSISPEHARALIAATPQVVRKTRYPRVSEHETWEIDVFHGSNEGLIIAEFEASKNTVARLKKPWWAGREITLDKRYQNENLATVPWPQWRENAD